MRNWDRRSRVAPRPTRWPCSPARHMHRKDEGGRMKDEDGRRGSGVGNRNGGEAAQLNSSFILHRSSFDLRVVKLGGSLLTAADWPNAFRRWLAIQPAM